MVFSVSPCIRVMVFWIWRLAAITFLKALYCSRDLVGYNLTRALMLEASVTCQVPLWRLSFKGTLDTVREFSVSLVRMPISHRQKRQAVYQAMLATIAKDVVPERPGRREPRCLKRRPKAYPFMTKPRRKMKDAPKSSRRKRKTS